MCLSKYCGVVSVLDWFERYLDVLAPSGDSSLNDAGIQCQQDSSIGFICVLLMQEPADTEKTARLSTEPLESRLSSSPGFSMTPTSYLTSNAKTWCLDHRI